MKRTARRKTVRRKFPVPALLAVVLLLFAVGMAAGGNGTPEHGQSIQDDASAQTPDPTGSAPALSAPPSTQGTDTSPLPESAPVLPESPSLPTEDNWALLLVNREHTLPDDYSVPELTQLRSGHAVDSRAYPALQAMMDDARSAGLQPVICSSYRTPGTQERLFEQEVQNWLDRGYTREEAMDKAAMWVARPGTSEHQTGLAVDIVDMSYQILDEQQERTPVQEWLMAHCAEYGFILRYPTDKSALTGIGYEPWHYRYVGIEAANEIMENRLCLEEYVLR